MTSQKPIGVYGMHIDVMQQSKRGESIMSMHANEKTVFVKSLIATIQTEIMKKIHKMPEEWDGIELRQYIADKFMEQATLTPPGLTPGGQKRRRNYRNTVLIENL
jgi:hypothetical protein